MGIVATDWLITSDVALEVAFRIDLPGPDRGRWVLSYLPADHRITRSQALAGVLLAELMVLEPLGTGDDWDVDMASAYAADLGLSLTEALTLLALRAFAAPEYGPDGAGSGGGDSPEPRAQSPCATGDRR
ncbi:hypothetical protein [Nocardia sp. BMG51109]|uniref:hypothetical protein n=1 Tax=Nocardia sp. BMG51109 TaxID=1056816 RepID=UPI00046683F3|nr:hypothetical protein [Nocardia sp. BMG51109]